MLEWTGQLVKHGSKLEEIEIAVMADEGEKDGEEYFLTIALKTAWKVIMLYMLSLTT
jgi:hypothetical protein